MIRVWENFIKTIQRCENLIHYVCIVLLSVRVYSKALARPKVEYQPLVPPKKTLYTNLFYLGKGLSTVFSHWEFLLHVIVNIYTCRALYRVLALGFRSSRGSRAYSVRYTWGIRQNLDTTDVTCKLMSYGWSRIRLI